MGPVMQDLKDNLTVDIFYAYAHALHPMHGLPDQVMRIKSETGLTGCFGFVCTSLGSRGYHF